MTRAMLFQAAIQSEGKTEEQALPPEQPPGSPQPRSHAGAYGHARPALSIATRFRRRRMFGGWRVSWESTSMM